MANGEVRKRTVGGTSKSKKDSTEYEKSNGSPNTTSFSLFDVLRIILGLVLLSTLLSWFITGDSFTWGLNPWWMRVAAIKSLLVGALSRESKGSDDAHSHQTGPVRLTDAELAAFNGEDPSKPIYVGLNGSIYDVSASPQTYGPGGSYAFFAGKDAARAYLTGCFKDDLTPDLRGVEQMYIPTDDPNEKPLTKGQLKIRREREMRVAKKAVFDGIDGWAKVFRGETGRPYFHVGQIVREDGWLEKLPPHPLCKTAEEGRAVRKETP